MRTGVLHSVRDRIACMRIRPLLQPFVDGELDDAQRRRVARHLEACRRCGLAAATFEALTQRLHDFDGPVDGDAVTRLERFVEDLTDDDRPADGSQPS